MQIGSVNNNHSNYHHVTDCVHTRATTSPKVGGASADASQKAAVQSQQIVPNQPEGQFSLAAWLDKTWNGAKSLWDKIWGSSDGAGAMPNGASGFGMMGEGTTLLGDAESEEIIGTPQIAAAATAIAQPQIPQNAANFVPVDNMEKQRETVWQRVKVRFKEVAGQLMGQLPGRFAGFFARNSFRAKQEQAKEDMRRKGKAHEDGVEFDSMAERNTHLMDSYDSTGSYRKLGEDVSGKISVRK